MSEQSNHAQQLQDAPEDIKLAVDLIQLLEEHNIEVDTAISALQIVLNDFQRKKQSETDKLKNRVAQ